tara:strand:- start:445 stop:759 length:315 start_codon:yes stop_codon:yes gene_type:complete
MFVTSQRILELSYNTTSEILERKEQKSSLLKLIDAARNESLYFETSFFNFGKNSFQVLRDKKTNDKIIICFQTFESEDEYNVQTLYKEHQKNLDNEYTKLFKDI